MSSEGAPEVEWVRKERKLGGLGSNNQTGGEDWNKGKKRWVDERKGRGDERKDRKGSRGPKGEPISARMGSLVYISSFISHPPV